MKSAIRPLSAELVAQWHPTLNGAAVAAEINAGSGTKRWWVCEKGHEWEASPVNRSRGTGCPTCSGQKILIGFNDLATVQPELAKQWHPTKNGELTPQQVTAGTSRKVWWLDETCGHEWEVGISNRIRKDGLSLCPVCRFRIFVPGVNDLATLEPEFAAQWHPTKNGDLTPSTVLGKSKAHHWWLCENGHEWETRLNARVATRSGCTICLGMKVEPGYNDFGTLQPEAAGFWHPTRNGNLTPRDLTSSDKAKYWWRSEACGHEWMMSCYSMAQCIKKFCPFCGNRELLVGFNDLATVNPELASKWHPTKNGSLTPNQVMATSTVWAWWLCAKGHKSHADVRRRNESALNGQCPTCRANDDLDRFNNLDITHPGLVAEWHPTKNGGKQLHQFRMQSRKKVWWLCAKGHEWDAMLNNRIYKRSGCPQCQLSHTSKIEAAFIAELRKSSQLKAASSQPLRIHWGKVQRLSPDLHASYRGLNVAFEYDGAYYHAQKPEPDLRKTKALLDAGYLVVRVREQTVKEKLDELDLQHPRLLQVKYEYRINQNGYVGLDLLAKDVFSWLDAMAQAVHV